MYILETISLLLILCLCFLCSKSDMRYGIIKNRILLVFFIAGIVLNIIYYGFFVNDLLIEYLINVGIVTLISLILFYTNSFAGGDCKMTIVLAILYPARFYLVYGTSNATLIFAVGFGIFVGYCYLVFNSLWAIITKKTKVTFQYITSSLFAFAKSYITATLYIFILNSIHIILNMYGIELNVWITRILCMAIAWCVGKYPFFKKKIPLLVVVILVVVSSIALKTFPFSLNPENYILVLVLLFCQMAVKTIIYEGVEVRNLKKGMILSSMSSILMQSSITPGLPNISTEDLRSRLTESEVDSVKIWAKATKTESLTIVKKIPFAIFISIGFISYLILWGILWV